MASVYQKRGTWYARVKDAMGAWRSLATKAASKTEARRLAEDIERRAERQRHGLEPLPGDSTMTLGELCAWWLRERCPAPSIEGERRRLDLHVTRAPLGNVPLAQVTPAALDGRLREMERDEAAPASVNKLRAVVHTVFSRAIKAQLWTGANPVAAVETRRVPRRAYGTLRAEEVPVLLPHVPEDWRGIFAARSIPACARASCSGFARRTSTWTTARSSSGVRTSATRPKAATPTRCLSRRRSSRSSRPRWSLRATSCSRGPTAACVRPRPIRRRSSAPPSRGPGWWTDTTTPAVDAERAARPTASGTSTRRRAGARSAA